VSSEKTNSQGASAPRSPPAPGTPAGPPRRTGTGTARGRFRK
jgi:hypothetical protein